MKILYLSKIFPYPLDSGVKIKSYKILNLLSQKHSVHLVSFTENDKNLKYENLFRKNNITLKTFVKPIITRINIITAINIIKSLVLGKPYIINKFFDKRFKDYVNQILKDRKFDIIYIDNIHMAQYIPDWYKGKIVIDTHEILYKTYASFSMSHNNPFIKLFLNYESYKLKEYELNILETADLIYTISKKDKNEFEKVGILRTKIFYLPIPYRPRNLYKFHRHDKIILFIGTLTWYPNLEGITWFLEKVFPDLKKLQNSKLLIIGNNSRSSLKEYLEDTQVILKDRVSDLEQYYKNASVFIAPILSGGGIKIKILDALSAGLPVVATNNAVGGIEAENKKDLIVNDSVDGFQRSILTIISNSTLSQKLSVNSRKFIRKNYQKKHTIETLELLKKLNSI